METVTDYYHKLDYLVHACHKMKATQIGTPRIENMSSQMNQAVETKDSNEEPEPVLSNSSIVSNTIIMMTRGFQQIALLLASKLPWLL